MINKKRYHTVLTIAGSDSGGCAGIQADIKSIVANGGFPASVITASTAQNTLGVSDIHGLPIEHIEAQLEAVFSDISFGAVKIGMLHSAKTIEVVAQKLEAYKIKKIILDPVMVSTSGHSLMSSEAIEALRLFIPKVQLITPNIPEAEILLGQKIAFENLEEAVKAISDRFSVSVLLKGGHLELEEEMTDVLFLKEEQKLITIHNPTIETKNTRGTGCSLSSSIATYVSLGFSLEEAVVKSCAFVNEAIFNGKDKILGQGNGPINHFGF